MEHESVSQKSRPFQNHTPNHTHSHPNTKRGTADCELAASCPDVIKHLVDEELIVTALLFCRSLPSPHASALIVLFPGAKKNTPLGVLVWLFV